MATTLQAALRAVLLADTTVSTLVIDRVFFPTVSQGTARPFVVCYRQGGGDLDDLDGGADYENPVYQVECVADTLAEAQDLAKAVKRVMRNWTDSLCEPEVEDVVCEGEENAIIAPVDDSDMEKQAVIQTWSLITKSGG